MKTKLLISFALLVLYSVSVAAQVGPKENPQVIQRTVEILNTYVSEASQAIGENDRDAFKETIKSVFKFHDLAPERYKNAIVDYSTQTNLLFAENNLKATLRDGLKKFGMPGDQDSDISNAMIRLIQDPIHIVPENKAGLLSSLEGSSLVRYGAIGIVVLLVVLGIAFRKRLGGLTHRFRDRFRKQPPLVTSQIKVGSIVTGVRQQGQSWRTLAQRLKKP